MTDPIKHVAQPNFPKVPSFSSKKYDPRTAPIKTLSAPRGVTKIAGANAYAAKFAISPTITVRILLAKFPRVVCKLIRTCYYATPPYRTPQVCEPISFETVSFFGIYQPLRKSSVNGYK